MISIVMSPIENSFGTVAVVIALPLNLSLILKLSVFSKYEREVPSENPISTPPSSRS